MYGFVIFLIKLAILLQCVRVFVPRKERNAMFWACHGLMWLNFIFYFNGAFLMIFFCTPVEKFWNPWIKGHCRDFDTINIVGAVINTASDVSILILPQPIIWNLKLPLKRKIGVSVIFLAGVL